MLLQMSGSTDVGKVRKNNQDSLYYDAKLRLAVVADGIGGRSGGAIASKIAVDSMVKSYVDSESLGHDDLESFLLHAVDQANMAVIQKGKNDESLKGMGTTLEFLIFARDSLYIAHVGDSRTYLFDQGHLWQLTIDHNVQNFIDLGHISNERMIRKAKPDALVKSLGLSTTCETDIYEIKTSPNQIYLTCSDGLSGMLSDKKILSIMQAFEHDLDRMIKTLLQEALKAGGRDNVTLVASKVGKE